MFEDWLMWLVEPSVFLMFINRWLKSSEEGGRPRSGRQSGRDQEDGTAAGEDGPDQGEATDQQDARVRRCLHTL